jgi:pimeloyl-ACP methyl ester carboxylesterase
VVARGQLKLARMAGTRGLPAVTRLLKTRIGPALVLSGMMGHPSRVPYEAAVAINKACGDAPGWDGALRVTSRTSFTGGSDVDVPVTLLWGTKDRLLPPRRMAPRVLRQIPHARHVPIDGAGHLPMWDAPDTLVREMLAA